MEEEVQECLVEIEGERERGREGERKSVNGFDAFANICICECVCMIQLYKKAACCRCVSVRSICPGVRVPLAFPFEFISRAFGRIDQIFASMGQELFVAGVKR